MALQHFDKNTFNEAISGKGLVMVDFWATWCGPCKMLTPVVEKLAEQYEGKAIVGKLDVDECPEVAGQFGVMSVPTVIFFKDGVECERKVGMMPQSAYTPIFDANL